MSFTHEQFAMAVERVGSHGRPFSSAAVRACLGMTADDKRTLTRFNHELHAYHRSSGGRVERLAKNRYRLRSIEPAADSAAPPAFDALDRGNSAAAPAFDAHARAEAYASCANTSGRPARATVHSSTTREDGQIKIRIVVRHAPRADDDDLLPEAAYEAPQPATVRSALDTLFRPMLRVFSR